MTLPFNIGVPRVKLTRERFLLLTMFGTSLVSFFVRLPLHIDEYVLDQVPGSLPQSYIEILFKASILGIILTVIIEDYGRYGPSNEPNPNRVLPYGEELPVKSKILNVLMSLLRRPVDWLNGRMPVLGKEIMMSNISRSPSAYLTLVIVGAVASVPISALGVLLVMTYGSAIRVVPPGILAFLLGLIPVFVFVFGLNAPKMSKSGRAGALDHELPYIMGYFNILASGGISPVIALRKLAKVARLFPAAAQEAKRILLDIDVFGRDPLSIYEKVGKLNPNKPFADFFAGYSTVIRSGGDTVSYIEAKDRKSVV